MYIIFKFSDSWSLYDNTKQTSRQLEKSEVDCLKNLFPALLSDNKILSAIEVTAIQPNKLTKQLAPVEKNGTVKKAQDNAKTSIN